MSQILFGPVPHEEAAQFIADKPAVSRAVFDRLLPEIKARTFLISAMVPLDIAQKLRDRIVDLPLGADWGEVKKDLVAGLSPFLDQKNEDGSTDAGPTLRKAELLLRTHGYQAYSAAQYDVLERQRDVFPYWRYQTAQDDRVRAAHAALEGVVVPADDPFWQTHFPPWDFNCRCTVVALSQADVEEITTDDQKKPADERSILSKQQIARMNSDGTLLRGPSQVVDVRSPRQKRDGDGYAWQPGDLHIPLATLRERYSPEVFSAFEEFAKNTTLEDGRSIHQWLAGAPAAPAPIAPPPDSLASSPSRPSSSPVSRAFNFRGSRSLARPALEKTVAAIDRVHDDGTLPEMKISSRPTPGALGHFSPAAKEIAINPNGYWPQMTAAHEAGHMLDFFTLGDSGLFASEGHALLAPWRAAVAQSSAIRGIEESIINERPLNGARYFLRKREIWARSYAQYIATKGGDPELLLQLDKIRTTPQIGTLIQWTDEDFKPIAVAIDTMFKAKGWIA